MINKHAWGVHLATRLVGMALLCAGWMASPASTLSAVTNGAQHFVAQGGSDTPGCGAETSPCATVSFLLPSVTAGDQINIAGEIVDNFTLTRNVVIAGASGAAIKGNGARVLAVDAGVNATLSSLTLKNGGGTQDGGLIHNAGALLVNNVILTQSVVAGASGGAIFNNGVLTLTNSMVSHNQAQWGGGIENQGVLVAINTTIANNAAGGEGGGIDNFVNGVMHLSRVVLISNTAAAGAGIYNDPGPTARVWLTDTAVVSNTAQNLSAGIFNKGHLSLANTTVSNNHFPGGLGVAIDHQSGTLEMRDVTIADNSVVNRQDASAVNWVGGGSMARTVIANAAVGNCSGTVASAGFNLSSDSSCAFNQPTDVAGAGARLGPLRPSSGAWRTYTHAPGPASPVVDRVPAPQCAAAADQRGITRPQNGACDIGAHEAVPIDLTLAAQSSQTSVPAGMPYTVQMTINNAGAAPATDVVLTGELPANTGLNGCAGAATCVLAGGRLTGTLGALSAGASATFSVTLVPQLGGTQVFTFNVAGAEWDRQDASNLAAVSVNVLQSADLSILLNAPVNVLTSALFTITAEVENRSAFTADAPAFTLTLPPTTTLVSNNGNLWSCDPAASQVTCQHAQALPPNGRSAPAFIVLRSGNTPATFQITGHVTSPTFDPNPGNNTSNRDLVVDRGFKLFAPLVRR